MGKPKNITMTNDKGRLIQAEIDRTVRVEKDYNMSHDFN